MPSSSSHSPSALPAPLRVALFTGAYNHIADGVSLTLNRLVAFLERQGAEVLVFGPTVADPPVRHAGTLVPVSSIPAPGRPDYRISLGLPGAARARLATFRPDLVHIATPDLLGLRARRWALEAGVPLVASYHTHFTSYLKYYRLEALEGLLWAYLRWFYRPCAHVYVPSPSMADVLAARGIEGNVRLWARGVDTDRFNPAHRSLPWRRSLGFRDDDVVVAYIGRLVWEKGLDLVAELFTRLEADGVVHRSLIVGDGPIRPELTARLPRTVFTGHLAGEALARAYASADVFVFPSETETFGNVTLEAMASGLPAVCADATGSRSLVEHGTTGYLAPPGDVAAFLGYVTRLVQDAALRKTMGAAARQRAQSYAWDVVLGTLLGYYEELLGRTSPPAATTPAVPAPHRMPR
ncbi:glycosyl transferase family 1 [Rhodothermaceae bacterium RA]|nr:glycosyl transferase family 1 [Rhodothermaceae bacterium RA]